MTAKSLTDLLKSCKNRDLGEIVQRAQDMGALTQGLIDALPAEISPGLRAANLKDGNELVLVCESSAWASRLRFEEDAILSAANAQGLNVEKLSVRVARVDGVSNP